MKARSIFNVTKLSAQSLSKCRVASSSLNHHHKPTTQPAADNHVSVFRWPTLNNSNNRIRLDGLVPPLPLPGFSAETVEEMKRVVRMEKVKTRLKGVEKSWVSKDEFLRICCDECLDAKLGEVISRMLESSGFVVVLGDNVLLKPEQVTKAIQSLLPRPRMNPDDAIEKELVELEKQKIMIDKKAEALVRQELWCGLGYIVAQTAWFMKLTFWDLTWDVMEPICFFVTSIYFMVGYAFFLKTSKEPSFEGFFRSRFGAKQKKLMKINNFDIARYNDLMKVLHPQSPKLLALRESAFSYDYAKL